MNDYSQTVTVDPGHAQPTIKTNGLKILYVVNVDWFFLSHRSAIARAARDAGYDVYVAAADTGASSRIKELGFTFLPIPMSRKGMHPVDEISTFRHIYRLYKSLSPDLVHHVTIKPVLFGSIAARFMKHISIVNAITGFGFMFSREHQNSLLGKLVRRMYRVALKNPRQKTIFQNPDDRELFVEGGYVKPGQTVVIRGSGVDCNIYRPADSSGGERIVLLASRMIRDKGIVEFYEAAKRIKKTNPDIRFILAGMSDKGNPNAVPNEQLEAWSREGVVEWRGHCENMVSLLQESELVVLPTFYPEGTPKILIEAAACGKPIVTTDRPGCREIVRDGINGLLIPPHNVDSLVSAIRQILEDPSMARRFGAAGRRLVIDEFSDSIVVSKTMQLYEEMIAETR